LKVPFQELRVSALQGRVVHIDDDDPELALHAATIARSTGTPVTSDLEHVSNRVEQLIASVTFPIFEQTLPARITGEDDPERALRKLRPLNEGLLVMTRGDQGAVALGGDTFHVAPAFEIEAVDATGAGDVFRAGFIYGLLQKWAVPDMLRFANAAAALSCTKLGAIPSVPTLPEVQALLASQK
jgi:sugar/nucleoside kinase (ribokinase family)